MLIPRRADDADMAVRRVAVIELGGRLVTDVDGRQLLDDVEREEADRGREHDLVERSAEEVRRLRDEVEEGRPDPDTGADGDDHADLADGPQRDEAAQERRDEGRGRDHEGGQRHQSRPSWARQSGHSPNSSRRCSSTRIAGLPRDIADDGPKTGIVDLSGPTAARAHDVVVVGRLAADIGMLAGWQVEPLDGAELLEDLERPEDRRPADAELAGPRGLGDELGGGEVAVLVGDQRGQRPARLGQAVAGTVERGDDRGRVGHRRECYHS